ncbi:response regulator [Thiomicrorhabdus cannonii]|uniref:response regulator n=1 Tax=Thiomicrorhabdus cannonii TaxID=2748011 RepID=UPI001C4C00FA
MNHLLNNSRYEILVVDDMIANVKLLTSVLEKQGYQVRAAINGEMALQSVHLKTPDLILLDIKMPNMNGFEVCQQLKADPSTESIPVIFISAMGETEDKVTAFRSGGVDYITKPFANEEVLARVNTHLQLHDYQTQLEERVRLAVLEIQNLNHELEVTQGEVISMMGATIEERSHETGLHVQRVAAYCHLLAKLYGVEEHKCDLIFKAAPLHDIGKVAIPDNILHKPGRLTDEEMAIMRSHAQKGYDIFKSSQSALLQMAALIAHQHHEKYDGNGYPQGLKGEEIDIAGRICAVADVFDALGHDRVYKKAWPLQEILDYFKAESGKSFEPKLVELLLNNLNDFLAIKERLHK